MAYKIDKDKCVSCGTCAAVCPVMAISTDSDGKYVIDKQKCMNCGTCAAACPMSAIKPDL